jgi:hypothetical protein
MVDSQGFDAERQRRADRQYEDTRILQKVNHAHHEAFLTKTPGQLDHCLRLTLERLQAGLFKTAGCDVADTSTWPMSTVELQDLANTAYLLNEIRKRF